jgi:hypothetical protein
VGIDPDKFWHYTYKEVLLLGESYNFNQNLEWERTRYLCTQIFNSRAEKSSQLVKPTKFFPLPQDKALRPKKPQSTYNQYLEFAEKIKSLTGHKVEVFNSKEAKT